MTASASLDVARRLRRCRRTVRSRPLAPPGREGAGAPASSCATAPCAVGVQSGSSLVGDFPSRSKRRSESSQGMRRPPTSATRAWTASVRRLRIPFVPGRQPVEGCALGDLGVRKAGEQSVLDLFADLAQARNLIGQKLGAPGSAVPGDHHDRTEALQPLQGVDPRGKIGVHGCLDPIAARDPTRDQDALFGQPYGGVAGRRTSSEIEKHDLAVGGRERESGFEDDRRAAVGCLVSGLWIRAGARSTSSVTPSASASVDRR